MSTSDKLTYLNTTKGKIKDTINLTGANITNEPFRQYSSKLYDSYLDILKNGISTLYSRMPKVPGTGTELSLQNTAEAPMVLELSASDSTQKTTTGKNKVGVADFNKDMTAYTIYCSNSEITINGTGNSTLPEINLKDILNLNGNYTISIKYISGSISGNNSGIILRKSGTSTNVASVVPANNDVSNSFNLTESTELKLFFWAGTSTFTNYKIKIQIEEGSVATDFEEYTGKTASPSPDYPQDINVVTGNNSIKIYNKNLCDGINQNYWLSNNANTCGYASDNSGLIIEIKNNTSYTISTIAQQARYRVAFINEIPTSSQQVTAYDGMNKDNTSDSITLNNTSYKYLVVNATDLDKIQIEKGSTTTPYVAHQEQVLPLNLDSFELAKISTNLQTQFEDLIFNNVSSSIYYNSSLTENGWYKRKYIKKIVLDGTGENFYNHSYGTNSYSMFVNEDYLRIATQSITLCNYFNSVSFGDRLTGNNLIYANTDINVRDIIFRNTNFATLNDFKTFLSTKYNNDTPVVIYYILATPINEQITDTTLISQLEAIKNAVSYDDETNISQTNANRPFVISASAIKNSME